MALTNSQYDEIFLAYETAQQNNRTLMDQRKEEIYSLIPRIREIDNEIAFSSIDAVRAKLRAASSDTEKVSEKNQALIQEKLRLLRDHNYPEDYLKPIYTCAKCKDTGRTSEGYCSCYRQSVISYLYKESEIANIIEIENFDHFDYDLYSKEADGTHPFTPYDNTRNMVKKCQEFIENFDNCEDNFLFYGGTGLGKTFLSNCIAKELLDRGHTVLYQSSIHLFEEVCKDVIMKKEQSAQAQQTYRYLYDCELLIIDDLGTEFTNSFVSSELYDILNTRMRSGKSTIISTNLNLQEINERYSDRIATRIFAEYKVFNFYGDNIRLAKRRKAINNETSN